MAWALFTDGHLRYYDKTAELHKIQVRDIDYVVTENPFPGGEIKKHSYKGRVEAFKNLCFAVGMVIQFAKSIEVKYQLIRPVDWKSFYDVTKRTPEAIQDILRAELTGVNNDRDLQDAIFIGMYFIDRVMLRMEDT
jgi:hypothetical protein